MKRCTKTLLYLETLVPPCGLLTYYKTCQLHPAHSVSHAHCSALTKWVDPNHYSEPNALSVKSQDSSWPLRLLTEATVLDRHTMIMITKHKKIRYHKQEQCQRYCHRKKEDSSFGCPGYLYQILQHNPSGDCWNILLKTKNVNYVTTAESFLTGPKLLLWSFWITSK